MLASTPAPPFEGHQDEGKADPLADTISPEGINPIKERHVDAVLFLRYIRQRAGVMRANEALVAAGRADALWPAFDGRRLAFARHSLRSAVAASQPPRL